MSLSSYCSNDEIKINEGDIVVILHEAIDMKGVCIDRSELNLTKAPYTIPNLVNEEYELIVFDKTTYNTIKYGRFVVYMLHQREDSFSVSPIYGNKLEKFFGGELEPSDFTDEYTNIVVGEGAFGIVSVNPLTHTVTKKDKSGKTGDIIKEIVIYSLLRPTKCLPELYAWDIEKDKLGITMEAGKGIKNFKNKLKDVRSIYLRLIECFHAISSQGVINSDVKPDNMVITVDGKGEKIDIIDWGSSIIERIGSNIPKNQRSGTPLYMAPELFLFHIKPLKRFDYKIDIYSLGISMLNIISNRGRLVNGLGYTKSNIWIHVITVFDWDISLGIEMGESPDIHILKQIAENDDVDYDILASKAIETVVPKHLEMRDEFINLIARMINPNPKKRADYEELVNHPYFDGLTKKTPPDGRYFNEPNIDVDSPWMKSKRRTDVYKTFWVGYFKHYKKSPFDSIINLAVLIRTLTLTDVYITRTGDTLKPFKTVEASRDIVAFYSGSEFQYDIIPKILESVDGNAFFATPADYSVQYLLRTIGYLIFSPSYYKIKPIDINSNLDLLDAELKTRGVTMGENFYSYEQELWHTSTE